MSTYVLIHAAWHTGEHYWPTASLLRAAGHHVFTPTMSGNRLGDQKTTGLAESIESVVEFISERNLGDVVLVGHSYGGIVITGVADRIAHRLRRLVYLSAFVANGGESLSDLVPPHYPSFLTHVGDGSVVLPYPLW